MGNLLDRIFRRENAIILILIVAALLGITDIPQRYGISNDKIILGLLGVLAVDALIEKIGYLERIESLLRRIDSEIPSHSNPDEIYKTRNDAPSFVSQIAKGNDIWIVAKGLAGFLNNYGKIIQKAALNGKRFRFIVHDPSIASLLYAITSNSFTNQDDKKMENMISEAIAQLQRMKSTTPRGSIEVKLAQAPLYNGYTIIDGDKPTGTIYVEMFGYKISLGERMTMIVSQGESPRLYKYHLERFKALWDDSKPA